MGDGIRARHRRGKPVEVHVWAVYNIVYGYNRYSDSNHNLKLGTGRVKFYISSGFTYNENNGVFTLKSGYTTVTDYVWNAGQNRVFEPGYWMVDSPSGSSVCVGVTQYDTAGNITPKTYSYSKYEGGKGVETGKTVESSDINAYPQNGLLGEYWYVYVGSTKKISSR